MKNQRIFKPNLMFGQKIPNIYYYKNNLFITLITAGKSQVQYAFFVCVGLICFIFWLRILQLFLRLYIILYPKYFSFTLIYCRRFLFISFGYKFIQLPNLYNVKLSHRKNSENLPTRILLVQIQ